MSYETDKKIFSKKKPIDRFFEKLQRDNEEMQFKKIDDNTIAVDSEDIENNNEVISIPRNYTYDEEQGAVYDQNGDMLARIVYRDLNKIEDKKDVLPDENIEEVEERDKKGKMSIFSKIGNFFSKKFKGKKKDKKDVLPDEDIEKIEERDKKKKTSIFSKISNFFSKKFKGKKKDKKDVLPDEDIEEVEEKEKNLELKDKIFKYLDGVNYTIKDLINILKKSDLVSSKEDYLSKLNEFIDKNMNLDKDKKLVALSVELCKLANEVEYEIDISKSEEIVKIFEEKGFDSNISIKNLYNEIITNSDKNSDKYLGTLYDYVMNNKENLNIDDLINEMNRILGKDPNVSKYENKIKELEEKLRKAESRQKELEEKIAKSQPEKKEPKENVTKSQPEKKEPKENVTKSQPEKKESNNINNNDKKEQDKVDISNANELDEQMKKSLKLQKVYERYNQIHNSLNEKLKELEYLKQEYSIIEKSIYGENISKLDLQEKNKLTLLASKEKLELLKEKLEEIKAVQMQIDALSSKWAKYKVEYGDIDKKVEDDRSNSYNSLLFNKEEENIRNKKKNESNEFFSKFSDEEIQAIDKYIKYEKTL